MLQMALPMAEAREDEEPGQNKGTAAPRYVTKGMPPLLSYKVTCSSKAPSDSELARFHLVGYACWGCVGKDKDDNAWRMRLQISRVVGK